jgi:glucose-1-phosphate cytidylyltransferase
VTSIQAITASTMRINAGFFVFRREIFRHMREGEELVDQPFQRLIAQDRLLAYEYDGFWMPMDTFKDKQRLDEIYSAGNPPWMLWNQQRPATISRSAHSVARLSASGTLSGGMFQGA